MSYEPYRAVVVLDHGLELNELEGHLPLFRMLWLRYKGTTPSFSNSVGKIENMGGIIAIAKPKKISIDSTLLTKRPRLCGAQVARHSLAIGPVLALRRLVGIRTSQGLGIQLLTRHS